MATEKQYERATLKFQEFSDRYYECNFDTFKKLIEDKGLPAKKIGKEWVMSRAQILLWLAKQGLKVG